jgi:hypothetical protein
VEDLWTDIYYKGTAPPYMRGREREEVRCGLFFAFFFVVFVLGRAGSPFVETEGRARQREFGCARGRASAGALSVGFGSSRPRQVFAFAFARPALSPSLSSPPCSRTHESM